mgnify:CR=1 FL=1
MHQHCNTKLTWPRQLNFLDIRAWLLNKVKVFVAKITFRKLIQN